MESSHDDYLIMEESQYVVDSEESWKYYTKWVALIIFLGISTMIILKWIGPFLLIKVIVPVTQWEIATFDPSSLALIIFASLILLPILFLPSTPSIWLAGMIFGYGIGFLLVNAGLAVGVSVTYFIGFVFSDRIKGWFKKDPRVVSITKLAGEGDWCRQFKAVALIRLSPFPYMVFNYAAAGIDVRFSPYLFGSLVGMVPEVLVTIYSGILIIAFADAEDDKRTFSTQQMILNGVGIFVAVAATVVIGVYAKRQLERHHQEEEVPILS